MSLDQSDELVLLLLDDRESGRCCTVAREAGVAAAAGSGRTVAWIATLIPGCFWTVSAIAKT